MCLLCRVKDCLQGERVTLTSRLTLAEEAGGGGRGEGECWGQKIARLHLKGLETIRKLTRLPGYPSCLVNTTKNKKRGNV